LRDVPEAASHADPRTTMSGPAGAWTGTPLKSSRPTSRAPPDSHTAWQSSARRLRPPGGQARSYQMTTAARRSLTATSTCTRTADMRGADAILIMMRSVPEWGILRLRVWCGRACRSAAGMCTASAM
jgi:hypothetical protein